MSKYNVGDKFIFEIKGKHGDEIYSDGEGNYYSEQYLDGCEKIENYYTDSEYEEVKQALREEGIEEAWNLVRKITFPDHECGMSAADVDEVFGTDYYPEIFSLSFHEAKEKIEAWKRKQKIQEGDEVEILGVNAVVLSIDNEIATVYVLDDEHAKVQEVPLQQLKKTGNSIDVMNVLIRACVVETTRNNPPKIKTMTKEEYEAVHGFKKAKGSAD